MAWATDDNLIIDLGRLDELPAERIPAAIAQLAAASQQLAARLLSNGTHGTGEGSGERLLTAKEAAPICGVSVDWLYDAAREGKLPFVVRLPVTTKPEKGKVPKSPPIRFSAVGIQKWIRDRSRSGR